MYLATLSDLANEPVLICEDIVATAKSAINVSSVSPDRCEMIVLKFAFFAIEITSSVGIPFVTAWAVVDPGVTNTWTEVSKGVTNTWTEVDKAA